ncbi:MAG TPA: enoyl-CoA hydratase-related protein [Acidimicrobiales bacterium]|nr:enoyl-CoA hydratase-related protein [Acidimicrobiales bacterium]
MPIRSERRGTVDFAIIDRPERRNALNADLCDELSTFIEHGDGRRVLVIGGAGDKAFCAGADLARRGSDVGGLEHGGGDTFRPAFDRLVDLIVEQPVPVVAAVNGAALGAGMQLAVACDVRVVAEHATFGIPAGRLGVMLSAANIARLASVVGQAMARDVLLTGRVLDVDAAERAGLVQRRGADALAAAEELGKELAELAPLSAAGHKRALNLIADEVQITPAIRGELDELAAAAFASEDLQEGLTAFSEKRKATFQGR